MLCKKNILIFLIAALSVFSGCSETKNTGYGAADTASDGSSLSIAERAESIKDLPPITQNSKPPSLEYEYIIACYEHQWYFCPPLDAVWQFEMIVDVCKSPPEVISVGDCIEKFECDPTNDTVETVDCIIDGVGGTQDKWCEKGVIKYTDCDPCIEEICDGIDNDCDELIDEDLPILPCENECGPGDLICIDAEEVCIGPDPEEEICDYKDNDCDGEIDENQLNDCGDCGPLLPEECNGFDDDCDGQVDEDLIQACSTDCGEGLEFCINGSWIGCSAKQPFDEICNGFDDDCDGSVDEDLDCTCTVDLVGALFPCFEPPLECGGGYKSCQCTDEDCKEILMSPCYAQCYWEKPAPSNCDPLLGFVQDEMCNNHDDNCNQLVDEDLYEACYTGPPETIYVGICEPGNLTCHKGEWGNNYITDSGEEVFIPELCLDEIVPADKDACNGEDDNCDGIVDDGKDMEDTDILFIIDWSGSMHLKIEAVMSALNMFATYYSDEEVIKWGLVIGPVVPQQSLSYAPTEYLQLSTPLTEFPQFMSIMSSLDPNSLNGGIEMLYDAVYLSVMNLVAPSLLPYALVELSWNSAMQKVNSLPQLGQFQINWRDDANHVIILFTDEEGQSYLYKDWGSSSPSYELEQSEILQAIQNADDLYVYTVTPTKLADKTTWAGKEVGWEPLTAFGGKWFELTASATKMYENLLEILDDTACSE